MSKTKAEKWTDTLEKNDPSREKVEPVFTRDETAESWDLSLLLMSKRVSEEMGIIINYDSKWAFLSFMVSIYV